MARETDMNSARIDTAQSHDESWFSLTVMSDQRLLAKLGGNLRDVYAELTDRDQPSDLMRLAAMIDARRGQSDR